MELLGRWKVQPSPQAFEIEDQEKRELLEEEPELGLVLQRELGWCVPTILCHTGGREASRAEHILKLAQRQRHS